MRSFCTSTLTKKRKRKKKKRKGGMADTAAEAELSTALAIADEVATRRDGEQEKVVSLEEAKRACVCLMLACMRLSLATARSHVCNSLRSGCLTTNFNIP